LALSIPEYLNLGGVDLPIALICAHRIRGQDETLDVAHQSKDVHNQRGFMNQIDLVIRDVGLL
jgi:hypothetical protein